MLFHYHSNAGMFCRTPIGMCVGLTERGFMCMHRYRFSEPDFPFPSEITCRTQLYGLQSYCNRTAHVFLMHHGKLVIMVINTKK